MKKSRQRLTAPMPLPTETDNPPTATQPSNATPAEGGASGGGQPSTQQKQTSTAEATITDPAPKSKKKRRQNASGSRKSSSIWDHFTHVPDIEVDETTAACNYCGKRYLADSKLHGTSNLWAHLKVCVKYAYAISHDSSQTVLAFTPGMTGELTAASLRYDAETCRKAVAMFVILDEHPFSVVEGIGFKLLINKIQPQMTVPSRFTVTRDCYQLYLDEKVRLRGFFKSNCNRVTLTTDCWTSIQNLSYLTLTAHFIDNDWRYQKRIISFSVVPNHKGETIGRHVEEILREWGLRNVFTLTVDNASSNDKAIEHLIKRVRTMGGLVLDGEFFHMRCCAHILNLVVNDGLKDLNKSINNIRNAVRFVRSSPNRLAKFKECIEFSNITSKKLVCLDVPTRWNSTYMMLDAAERFQPAFEKMEFEELSYVEYFGTVGPPTAEDWESSRVFVKFLKIFYDATKIFSASTHVSMHSAFHQLALIHMELKKCCNSSNSSLRKMGVEMKLKYDKYWGNIKSINKLLYFGVIFDPRYKFSYVEWSFLQMYGENPTFLNEMSTSVKDDLTRMYNWYASAHEERNRSVQSSHDPLEGSGQGASSTPVECSSFLERADAFKKHLKEKSSIDRKTELETYLSEANVEGNDKFDLLLWWKQNSGRFPILSSMVRDVLATPVSTVASESAFSTGGRVLEPFRSSLSPKIAEGLICAQNWLKPSLYQFKDQDLDEEWELNDEIVAGIVVLFSFIMCYTIVFFYKF